MTTKNSSKKSDNSKGCAAALFFCGFCVMMLACAIQMGTGRLGVGLSDNRADNVFGIAMFMMVGAVVVLIVGKVIKK